MHYNKIMNVEDLDSPELFDLIREIYPHMTGVWYRRKVWEGAMILRTIKDYAGMRGSCLSVGAGTENLGFYLTNFFSEMHMTDLYANADIWHDVAPAGMLVNPAQYCPTNITCDLRKLVVQHMDGRFLRYPDDRFDVVICDSSIEHFGALGHIEQAAREMGRVLKPGGLAIIVTEFMLSGPGDGWPGTKVFSHSRLQEHILNPSGLRLLDELDLSVSEATLQTATPLSHVIEGHTIDPDTFREVVLNFDGYTFTSVHLALVKDRVNPYLSGDEFKEYEAALQELPEHERRQALLGTWFNSEDKDGSS